MKGKDISINFTYMEQKRKYICVLIYLCIKILFKLILLDNIIKVSNLVKKT